VQVRPTAHAHVDLVVLIGADAVAGAFLLNPVLIAGWSF
jgi:hypothetical protein